MEGDRRNRDLVLIHAESAEAAYQKALLLGHENQISYENP